MFLFYLVVWVFKATVTISHPTRISWNVIHGFVAVAHVKSSFGNSFVWSRQVAPSFVQAIFRLIAGVPTKYVQESIPSILVPWQSTRMWRDDGDGMRMMRMRRRTVMRAFWSIVFEENPSLCRDLDNLVDIHVSVTQLMWSIKKTCFLKSSTPRSLTGNFSGKWMKMDGWKMIQLPFVAPELAPHLAFFQAKDHVRGAFMQEFPQWLETGWPQKSGQLEWSWSEWNKMEIDWHVANAELNIAQIATRHPFLILFDLFSGRKSGSNTSNRVMDSHRIVHQVAR